MDFPEGYEIALDKELQNCWPNLKKNVNFWYTSFKTFIEETEDAYNCFSWAVGIDNLWLDMYYFQRYFKLDPSSLDHSANGYAFFMEMFDFKICTNGNLENGFEKIAIYEQYGEFQHVALQKSNGNWKSKMGQMEDIEHKDLNDISGIGQDRYGTPKIYMKRSLKSSRIKFNPNVS